MFVDTCVMFVSSKYGIGYDIQVLLHVRSFFEKIICAYHTLARIKVVHLRSVLVLHLRVYFHSSSLASC